MENTTSNTNNFLNWVEIKNFKSIKDLRLDCKRVNVFIGRPNVGKSNILEGLGLLGTGYDTSKYLNGVVRYNVFSDLFIDNSSEHKIQVSSNNINVSVETLPPFQSDINTWFQLVWNGYDLKHDYMLKEQGELYASGTLDSGYRNNISVKSDNSAIFHFSPVKKYEFSLLDAFKNNFKDFLLPPHGWNMYSIVKQNDKLWQEFASLFKEQNLEFVLLDRDQSFALQKKEGFRVKQYPYFSIADTLRRFMFYITAIESNKNSVLVFEEPEVHSFPPYTQDVAYRMIYSEENQFFVSTHSPYLLHTLVENLKDDKLNVFVTYYENYETKVKALTPEELSFVQEYSTDVFFNLDRFIPNARPANPA